MDQYSSKNESAPFKLPEVQQEPTDDVQAYESVAKSTDESAMSKAVEQNSISNPLTSTSSQPITPIHIDPATFQSPSQPLQSDSGIKKIAVTDDLSAKKDWCAICISHCVGIDSRW